MKKFCFQSPRGDFSWKSLSWEGKKKITPCMCLYVIFLLDLDLYKQRHYDSHHICVKGMGQPCSSGLWQTGTWDDPGAGRCLHCRLPHTLWAQWEVTALIANCRNREHGGRGAKEMQEEAMRGISASRTRPIPASFPRLRERSGKCNGRRMAYISPGDTLPLAALGAIYIWMLRCSSEARIKRTKECRK